ncbi:ribonuclease P protein component [Candidatus Saccharibacteria bacterium]|nr:ribonuclease P protein component [Candidatus Saccharibacteria bacterium]
MISQKYRFHGHGSLRYVLTSGHRTRSEFFTIKWAVNQHRHYPRVAIIVSKKIFKSAVKRNRLRRRLYEIIRPLLLGAPAIDIVISVHLAAALTATHQELAIQLLPLLHQTGLKTRIARG